MEFHLLHHLLLHHQLLLDKFELIQVKLQHKLLMVILYNYLKQYLKILYIHLLHHHLLKNYY